MQTVPVSVELLQACQSFITQAQAVDHAGYYGLQAMLGKALAAAPRWSNSLAPLYALANSTGRPVAGLDIEATGTDPQTDKIVELVIVLIEPNDPAQPTPYNWLVNPGRPIPAEATAVHHITDQDVAASPLFASSAADIAAVLEGATIVGFNSNHYDVPLLMAELGRAGIIWPAPGTLLLDPSVIFRRKERRRLSDAVKTYCYQDGETAHRAEADAYQALAVLAAQLERFPELGAMNAEQLDNYCNNEAGRVDFSGKLARDAAGQVVFAFGKHKGRPVKSEAGYANWMRTGDFPADTKAALAEALK